jgi:hypothetical protein
MNYSLGIIRMNVFFIQRDGTDLHHTLYTSETSRTLLRFYHPVVAPAGVIIQVDSLVSGLSIAGELRWYIRRYMQDVLFEVTTNNYYTLALSRQIYYDREIKPEEDWPFCRLYIIHKGRMVSAEPMKNGNTERDKPLFAPGLIRFIVRCTEQEFIEPRKTSNNPGEMEQEEDEC